MPRIAVAEAPGVGLDGRDRPTEDVVMVLEDAVVVLDGATSPRQDMPTGGAYAIELGAQLVARLTAAPELPLTRHLGQAIRAVARGNGYQPGSGPSSTVALLRWTDDEVEALVLADSPVVVFTPGGPDLLADTRLADLPAAARATHEEVARHRNRDGGFWVAEAVPAAAERALCRSWPRSQVEAVLVTTDGVSCGVDDYGLLDWPGCLALARAQGPQALLDAVREAERGDPDRTRWPRPKVHDDQAAVFLDFTG
ncbi:protein phosphatase 2C domain-containing protein [Actinokineospora bangkokensis]|uniref:Protein phosphatase 2C domain-containing protein n=1 Tax=Actinokineospora bangkokensis TaxID=1193682 RepID=A0A1Q9LFI6_9PSEU|nr:protein phosphatase 2C domain-containing protein [Actinokineospora bangkokensis]OLR90788.1 hypothetical protein BJP25_29870 [Actinokineospora bangkokensis]